MSIKKIKIVENSGDEKLYFSGRSIEVHTTKNSNISPGRCSTTKEYTSLMNIPAQRVSIQDFISIIPRKLFRKNLNPFIKDNGIHKQIADYLIKKIPSTRYSSIILSPIILPKINELDFKLYETFSRRSLFIQNYVKESLGKVKNEFLPSLFIAQNLSLKNIESLFNNMSQSDCWVPVIPLYMPKKNFQKAVNLSLSKVGTYQVPMILFVYSDPLKNLDNYDYIWNNNSKEIIFSVCDAPREKMNELSTSHYLHPLGIDYIGRRVHHIGGPGKKSEIPQYLRVKYFNKNNLTINTENNISENIDILQDLPYDNRIKTVFDNREKANTNQELNVLKSISNVHEFYSSSNEFKRVSKFTKNKEYGEYLKGKKILNDVVNLFSQSKISNK